MLAEDIRHPEKQPIRKEVGKNIKDKKRDKRGRDRDPSQEGSLKKERSFQTPGNTLTAELERQIRGTVLRWQRNRTGRPLSPQQIHRKII